ncbi:uncharacterized protein LOC110374059 [Helicoverpa armigera]|uniref:uncharacterized protein LOC110374059 n=1 Tax=Helicoverpa armigera TaxID=29058 RepID=UPI0030834C6E
MGFKNLPYVSKAVLVPIYITVLLWMFTVYHCCIGPTYLPTYIMAMCSDLNSLTVSLLLFGFFSRMRIIQNVLENNFVPVNIVGKDQLQKNVKIVRKCVGYYSNLLDSFDAIHTQFQITLAVSLICRLPSWVVRFYDSVQQYLQTQSVPVDIVSVVLVTMMSLFVTTSPAFVSELISNEIDAIKATLVTQLVRCSDPSLSSELEVALHYIHIRPFKFVICRAVPVDINMPITIVGFCITYVIVIMQFIHFSNL